MPSLYPLASIIPGLLAMFLQKLPLKRSSDPGRSRRSVSAVLPEVAEPICPIPSQWPTLSHPTLHNSPTLSHPTLHNSPTLSHPTLPVRKVPPFPTCPHLSHQVQNTISIYKTNLEMIHATTNLTSHSASLNVFQASGEWCHNLTHTSCTGGAMLDHWVVDEELLIGASPPPPQADPTPVVSDFWNTILLPHALIFRLHRLFSPWITLHTFTWYQCNMFRIEPPVILNIIPSVLAPLPYLHNHKMNTAWILEWHNLCII